VAIQAEVGGAVSTADQIALAGVFVQAFGFLGTIAAGIFALKTFRRDEQWKRVGT
jgi:hypothetical protein